MNRQLQYPFDAQLLLRRRKAIRRELMAEPGLIDKRIAILGGSTTHDIRDMLELFLLDQGIRPEFYESEYGQYWQDAMFPNERLESFRPDAVYIHTSVRNILTWPEPDSTLRDVEELLGAEMSRYTAMWDSLARHFRCPIIQNNFEYPFYRLLGNQDGVIAHGRVRYVSLLNMAFADSAREREDLYINDINWLSADYGLERWSDPFFWHMYKYSLCLDAVPTLAHSVSSIIKSLFGRNRKALALDLDNTLWGGVVGDDGVEGIAIGQETSMGQVYWEFQQYLKELKKRGVPLSVISKNDRANAMAGLEHPDAPLKPEDFVSIKANWEPKSVNLTQMAGELSLLPESFVFVDDNPAEREIVRQQVPGVCAPELDSVENYIRLIDRSAFFEVTKLSGDDLRRSEMYRENAARAKLQASFPSYRDYLLSLEMRAVIRPFESVYIPRIAQLTNKSNQFNLTTRRYTPEEIRQAASDPDTVTLYGKLEDRFGDNGVVSVVIAKRGGGDLDIVLWLMSCRVLKRDMEFAMMDELCRRAAELGVTRLIGHYCPTARNGMVRDFYALQGFTKTDEDGDGATRWELDLSKGCEKKQDVIKIEN